MKAILSLCERNEEFQRTIFSQKGVFDPMNIRFHPGCLLGISIMVINLAFSGCQTTGLSISDRFKMDSEDVITDLLTGMQWQVGPDTSTDWYSAVSWISNLEGSWRFPTYAELMELWDAGVSTDHWGPFENGGCFVWCIDSEAEGGYSRFCFHSIDPFEDGNHGVRAFAVLPPRGGWTTALEHRIDCRSGPPSYLSM